MDLSHDDATERIEAIGRTILASAIQVHRELGPGLLESTYHTCLSIELRRGGLTVESQLLLPIRYGGHVIEGGYRLDMLVDESVIIENKAVQSLLPVHEAQLLTYLKVSGCRLGFLINWNVRLLRNGIKRMVNNL